jgi:hypothetical protein
MEGMYCHTAALPTTDDPSIEPEPEPVVPVCACLCLSVPVPPSGCKQRPRPRLVVLPTRSPTRNSPTSALVGSVLAG